MMKNFFAAVALALVVAAPQYSSAATLSDAIAITSATSGKVLAEATVAVPSLNTAQKTALASFVTSLGASWPGNAAHILNISLYRVAGSPNSIGAVLQGLIVHNDAVTAVNQLTSGATSAIVGIVP